MSYKALISVALILFTVGCSSKAGGCLSGCHAKSARQQKATLYSTDGKEIRSWSIDETVAIERYEGTMRFLSQGKRVTIQGTWVVETL